MKRRHCGICGLPGHDRRAHDRRNPEFTTGPNGVVHPIRKGKGVHKDNGQPYDPAKAKGDEKTAKRARQVAKGGPALVKAVRSAAKDLHRIADEGREAYASDAPRDVRRRLREREDAAQERYDAAMNRAIKAKLPRHQVKQLQEIMRGPF